MKPGRIVIAGASGFIGRALVRELAENGHEVVALTRNAEAARARLPEGVQAAEWDGRTAADWRRHVDGALAIVNLVGDNLARGRWTRAKKERIVSSRALPGAALVQAVREAGTKPLAFVQASAVGFYGNPGEAEIDESSPPGAGFLAGVVRQWEGSTRDVEAHGVRRVVTRSGLVLGRSGGSFPTLVRPFRFLVGGPLGGGRQWFSWISLEDEVRAIRLLIGRRELSGPFDLTAPEPVRQKDLCRIIGKAMRRPCWFPVPAALLRLLFGEKAEQVLLVSQRVLPRRLVRAGFEFRHPDAASAVSAILR
ncbi:MAG: TIGR01777 family protein [Candidatus Aminicenantes bacterium]|nr:MAG: TIGR01777 family protein [Candidatus Aminicenantes bacterium]